MNMAEARTKLKRLAHGKHYALRYEFSEHPGGEARHTCDVYIDGYNYHHATTWEHALDLLQRQMAGKPEIREDLTALPLQLAAGNKRFR